MTYGAEYGVEYKCPSCGAQNNVKLSLMDLDVVYANELDDFSFTHELIIPKGDTITFHLPTLEDEKLAAQAVTAIKKRTGSIDNYEIEKSFARNASLIDEINGEKVIHTIKKIEYLNNMPANVYNDFIELISSKDVGISPTVDIECPSCQWVDDVRLGITAEFFRPKSKRT
jgi:phage FluMu protein Com